MHFGRSNSIALNCVADSRQGGRPENQDDYGFLDTHLGFLFIVCDGMGGGPGGKTASYIVKNEIARALSACSPQMATEKAIRMAVARAQEAIQSATQQRPELQGMGSTFVAVLVSGHSAFVAHAGDSRCYQLRGNRVVFRTTDHSLVAELVKRKSLTEEEARTSPQSNVISRGLGGMSNHTPDVVELPYQRGDRFVLCTDGVWGAMPGKDLVKRLSGKQNMQALINILGNEIDRIGMQTGGGHDNHTIGMVEMECDSVLKAKNQAWIRHALLSVATLLLLAAMIFGLPKACDGLRHYFADTSLASDTSAGGNSGGGTLPTEELPPDEERFPAEGADTLSPEVMDSLRRLLNKDTHRPDSTNAPAKPDSTSAPAKPDSTSAPAKTDTVLEKARELTQRSINRLDAMLSKKYDKLNEATRGQEKIWREFTTILKDLDALELPVETQRQLEDILAHVGKEETARKAQIVMKESKGRHTYYVCASGARKEIGKIRAELEQLIKKFT